MATGERRGGEVRAAPTSEEVRRRICALFDACRQDESAEGARDAALVSVLFGAGLPRSEALALRLDAYDPGDGTIRPPSASVRRALDGALRALADWLEVRGRDPGPLFTRIGSDGAVGDGSLEPRDVDRILERRAREAGIEPHDGAVDPELFRSRYRSPWWTTT